MQAPLSTTLLSADPILETFVQDHLSHIAQVHWAGTLDPAKHHLQPTTEGLGLMIIDLRSSPEKIFDLLDLAELHYDPMIIFLHDSDQYWKQSFKYFTLDYLLTPLKSIPFQIALKKALHLPGTLATMNKESTPQEMPSHIPIKSAGKIQLLPIRDITHIEASGYYIEINTNSKKHLLRDSMSAFMNKLPANQYARIHRSTIIRLDQILDITRTPSRELSVTMKTGPSFKISSSYKKSFFKKLHI